MASITTREDCLRLDATDSLAPFRERFSLPEGIIYLDGNSLGALPKAAPERARDVIAREWGTDLIASWNTNDWFDLPVRIGTKLAKLVGGESGACVATDTTSITCSRRWGRLSIFSARIIPSAG